ncbi:MAG TPA: biotin/lipoyl-binding protein [Clostridia bacterium]|nr:biotin/lipoyl-binding protein [Clostridia bacterium]
MLRKFKVTVNNETYEVLVEEVTENNQPAPAATAAPPAPPTPPPPSSAPAPAAAPATPPAKGEGQSVVSPLPGVVLSINVKVGDQVTAGQTVVILEAMKMENEIPAPINGTVTSILVSKGQSVNTNDVLLTIK